MANNTKITIEKPISEVKVGDHVMNKDMKSTNKVVFLETHAGIDPDENYILLMVN